MEYAARRFARWVLTLHVALLVVVLLVIASSVRTLYLGARAQAIEQSKQTQQLLARQTALGLQSYYDSIINSLELLQPQLDDPLASRSREQDTAARMAPAVWRSVIGKLSILFVVDTKQSVEVVRVVGAVEGAPDPRMIVEQASGWIAGVSRASISPFLKLNTRDGVHLICVPMRGSKGAVFVGVAPVTMVEQSLLKDVNAQATTGAMIVDDNGIIVSAVRDLLVGLNVKTDAQDPRTRQLAERYIAVGNAGTEVFEHAEKIGDELMEPAMVTIEPAEILGRRWYVAINSSLSDIDKVVKPIFRDALLWAGFVAAATTLILVSTSVQSIRGRIRIERLRAEIISKELAQAREIQLAWLPDNDDDPPQIDLSAVNQPATQISGDFYNWFQLCDGRTAVVIGDVTGHGMAAAFLMATTQLLVRTTLPRVNDPGQCLEEVNRQLCYNAFSGQFVTMQILVIDVQGGEIAAATAGHPAPLVGEGESFSPLTVTPQLVLGVDADASYFTENFRLARGSSLVLFTDGVIDALNLEGKRFTVEGLAQSLFGRYESAQAIIDAVISAVDRFRGDHALPDDLTLVAVQLQEAGARAIRERVGVSAVT